MSAMSLSQTLGGIERKAKTKQNAENRIGLKEASGIINGDRAIQMMFQTQIRVLSPCEHPWNKITNQN